MVDMPFVEFCKLSKIEQVKQLLREDATINMLGDVGDVIADPILYNPGFIMLQFSGWDIQLLEDGTWTWTDTTGG